VTYIDAMKEAHLFSPEHADVIDVKKSNSAMAKSRKWGNSMTLFNGTNATNVWCVTYDRVHFYMVSEPCQQVQYPAKLDIAWCQEVYRSEIGILRWTCLATKAGFLDEVVDGVFDCLVDILDDCNVEADNHQQNLLNESIAAAAAPATVLPPSVIYWDSTDARKLFGALPEDENVITTLEQKISKLKASNQTAEGY